MSHQPVWKSAMFLLVSDCYPQVETQVCHLPFHPFIAFVYLTEYYEKGFNHE